MFDIFSRESDPWKENEILVFLTILHLCVKYFQNEASHTPIYHKVINPTINTFNLSIIFIFILAYHFLALWIIIALYIIAQGGHFFLSNKFQEIFRIFQGDFKNFPGVK